MVDGSRWQITTKHNYEDMLGGCKLETVAVPIPSAMQEYVRVATQELSRKCQQHEIELIIRSLDYNDLIQLRELICKQIKIRES